MSNTNPNGQIVVAQLEAPGNHRFSKLWVMLCSHCRHEYGANGCDAHNRRCPKCQSGRAGLALPVAVATAIILLFTADVALSEPRIPTEVEKIEALKLGYQLNGNSMVGWGSIDLSQQSIPPPVRNVPIVPKKKEK